MPLNIGWTGILFIAVIGILFFGPSKLPQLGKAIGTTLREFRAGTKDLMQSEESEPTTKQETIK
ncbi:Sec-independent protein translocase protein TatAd [Paenibacillus baekrokdamisoli]|uniref:Sec-independent protein translocase protein TatA n=1 Tax=Paenibacillus baekrokdamisoli TaxID=1712516 RepID=A0A3G9JDU0_9BACL|nr:twin-arginine translocase TatA/TatE family subunit [Paenibacillus baekrokdamisoli]MBB3070348.1 sec-independent protein translocase protein TatA [Paenibacillus baekrokdamisoli]BBH21354.1 Sec-independent protein translocase protein TatAd [Paenibacillus baekrokdamisoli]